MIKLDFSYPRYQDFFKYACRALDLNVEHNKAFFRDDKGEGYISKVFLADDFQMMAYKFRPAQDIMFHRKKNNSDYYQLGLERQTKPNSEPLYSLFFGSVQTEFLQLFNSDVSISALYLLFSKNFLESILKRESGGEFILKSLVYSGITYRNEKPNLQYFKILDEVAGVEHHPEKPGIFYLNRANVLVEYFFTRYFKNFSDSFFRTSATSDEMSRIQSAERLMLKDYSEAPPSIEALSRLSAMSPTKFKLLFKEIFGLPVYQYYQKHRMQKAKAMLLSQRYSTRQVASELGFTHIKDFVKAFYKQFEQEPDDLIRNNE